MLDGEDWVESVVIEGGDEGGATDSSIGSSIADASRLWPILSAFNDVVMLCWRIVWWVEKNRTA